MRGTLRTVLATLCLANCTRSWDIIVVCLMRSWQQLALGQTTPTIDEKWSVLSHVWSTYIDAWLGTSGIHNNTPQLPKGIN